MTNLLIKQPNQILSDMLRSYKAGAQTNVGIANPQVDPGSEVYIRFQTFSNELAIAMQNIVIQGDAQMPDTAIDGDLDRIVGNYGLTRRGAGPASGFITITCNQSTLVPTGSQLISNFGLIYQVTLGGAFSNGQSIPINSVDKGFATNLAVNSVLTWLSTPAFSQSTASVSSEIAGGVDLEDDNTLRARLFAILQNPPMFGNWQDVANLAESFDPVVQKSFIYPAANGPATQHLALTGYTTSSAKNRDIPVVNLTNLKSSISGNLPSHTDTTITTVQNANFDIAFNLTIPYPIGAPNLGTGGGWSDYSPFPVPNAIGSAHNGMTSFAFCSVNTVTSSNSFSINAPLNIAPVVGITKIQWVDRSNGWIVITATIIQSSGTGPYNIVTDQPFTGIVAGDYIFPASNNAQIYLNAVLVKFTDIGPGEKTNIATLLPRAARKPRPNFGWNNVIDANMARQVINSGSEVLDCDFYARRANTSQTSGVTQQTILTTNSEVGSGAPPLPSNITYMPIIYIPNNIGFYPPSTT